MPDNDQLENYRQVSDPEGDRLIEELYKELSPKEIGRLFQKYMSSLDELNYDDMPAALRSYFMKNMDLPDWADRDKMKQAEALFLKIGPEYSLALLCRGLAVGYTASNVVKVLTSTGYLSSDVKLGTAKRIMETTQFVLDVMSCNGMRTHGRGIKSTLKVRFIHSMVRYHLQKHGWDNASHGIPINQEDMAGTILTFSVSAILGLQKMNIHLSEEEKDAIVHFWSVVGHVIGIERELNPSNYKDAVDLYEIILERQAAPTEDGKILTAALANFIKATLDLDLFPDFQEHLMRFLIDNDRYSDMLNIAKPKGLLERSSFTAMINYLKIMNQFREIPLASHAVKPINRLLIIKLLAYFESEFDMTLHFPEEIRQNWGIMEKNELSTLRKFPFIRSVVAEGKIALSLN